MKNIRVGGSKKLAKRPTKIKTENNKSGMMKKLFLAVLVLSQLILIIYLHLQFIGASRRLFLINIATSLITSIYVLSTNKNGLSKAVWIMFLLVCFPFSSLIYWLSDERLFFFRTKRRYKAVFDETEQYETLSEINPQPNLAVRNDCAYFSSVGKFSVYDNSDLEYFPSGELLFADVVEQIKKAKSFVFIEFFIVQDGVLFDRIFDILCEKARNGVEVRLIYDDLGSKGTFSYKAKKRLKNAGVKLYAFNKFVPFVLARMNYRNHRKIVVVDGVAAYTGGCNLADEYANIKEMNGYWKDVGAKISGGAVDGFTLFFLRQWEFVSGVREDYSVYLNKFTPQVSDGVVIPYVDGIDYSYTVGRGVYENIIAGAQEFIYIMSPYFVVDDGFLNLLINKALSGVDVRIVLPDIPDKTYVYGLTRSNAEKLIDYGVKVYTMSNSFVHAKVVMSENCVALGSVNIDLRSFHQQFECGVYTNLQKFRERVKNDFNEVFANGKLITEDKKHRNNLFYRIKAGIMQLFAPFM